MVLITEKEGYCEENFTFCDDGFVDGGFGGV